MHIPQQCKTRSYVPEINPQTSKKSVGTTKNPQTKTANRKKFEFPASITAATLAIAALIGVPTAHDVASAQMEDRFGPLDQITNVVFSTPQTVTIQEENPYVEPAADEIVEIAENSEIVESETVKEISAEDIPVSDDSAVETALPEITKTESEPEINIPLVEIENTADFSNVTSADFQDLSLDEKVELIGKMAREDDKRTGVPASLTAAQAIIESGWMDSGLTRDYENYYGIKASSDGYNWPDSTWDGRVADMSTGEEYGGYSVEIVAGFRVYDNAWQSMQDHSAYLLNNTRNNGAERRYPDIEKCETAEDAIDIVIEGGYATSSSYRSTIMSAVEKYDLTRFDYTAEDAAMDAEATLASRAEKTEQVKKEQLEQAANASDTKTNTQITGAVSNGTVQNPPKK